jgi:hypothetical protein
MAEHDIRIADIEAAHASFQAREPRDVFYRTAMILVDLTLRREIELTVEESLAVLLQTWNKNYYRFTKKFDEAHFDEIRSALDEHQELLTECRQQTIEDLKPEDEGRITALFETFEKVLGAVGAAKALHLLAPRLFPLWDRAIAKGYHVPLRKNGSNSGLYWGFMRISKGQCLALREEGWPGDNTGEWREDNALKAIDEYNYCRYTLKVCTF